ncbi:MAG: DNA-binding protein [Candidatus Omnitrophota bacterium]
MRYACLAVWVAVFFAGRAVCLAQAASSTELIAQAKDFDGKTVIYAGEVVGDVMKRGDNAWINVNDGASAVGVWITGAMAGEVGYAGDFKHAGDKVEIAGVFNRVCGEHGGDLDIHAQSMRVVQPGAPVPCSINKVKKDWAIKLLGVVAIIWTLSLLKLR